MVQTLELNVGKTYAAVVIGERNANGHPSAILGMNPSLATDHLIYNMEADGVVARVMVSQQRRMETADPRAYYEKGSIRPTRYQGVTIIVKGTNPAQVKDYAGRLARDLRLVREVAHKLRYARAITEFLGGDEKVRYKVEDALTGTPQRS